jgi:hypothetical protein
MRSEISKYATWLCLLLFQGVIFAQPELELKGPEQIKIGTSTIVKVVLKKLNTVDGPARLSLELPEGWIIENYPGEVAEFHQQGRIARVVWLEFPSVDSLSITAMLRLPSKNETGSFNVTSQFEYLKNGKKSSAVARPKTIKISRYFSRF